MTTTDEPTPQGNDAPPPATGPEDDRPAGEQEWRARAPQGAPTLADAPAGPHAGAGPGTASGPWPDGSLGGPSIFARTARRPVSPVTLAGLLLVLIAFGAAIGGSEFGYFASRTFSWGTAGLNSGSSSISIVPTPAAPTSGTSGSSAAAAGVAAKVTPGLVDINTFMGYSGGAAAGTGMVLASNGEVLTNNHVIDQATSITATDLGNGQTYLARVVGYDNSADVAVLQLVGASGLHTVQFASSTPVRVGQSIVGIGNAGGTGGAPAVAPGDVTALDQHITATDALGGDSEHLSGLIGTSADIVPGDSGGPLVNDSARVVGMDTAASANGQPTASGARAFAIPANEVRAIAAKIIAGTTSAQVHIGGTAFMGVAVAPQSSKPGADVVGVMPNTPAADAGIGPGDVITAVNNARIASAGALTALLAHKAPGETVRVTYRDFNGSRRLVSLRLASGPAK